MADVVDALELELLHAATRLRDHRRRHSWQWFLGVRRRLLLAGAAAVVVGTPALAAVTDTWPGSNAPREASAPRVQFPVSSRDADRRLRSALAVLRQPRSPADDLPADASLPPLASGVRLKAARQLRATPDGAAYLVPVDAVLSKPLQVAQGAERSGPSGVCLASTGKAPEAFSCVATGTLLDEGAGVIGQLGACAPGGSPGAINMQLLVVDGVADLTATLDDGGSRPLVVSTNLVNETFDQDNSPTELRWSYGGQAHERALVAPPGGCQVDRR